MGTYWSAQVAEDQLEQSKEQDEDKAKDQASKVTYWLEDHESDNQKQLGASRNRLVIVNRSLDPVKQVGFLYRAYEGEMRGSVPIFRPAAAGGSWIPTIPPCSKITVESTSLLNEDGSPVSHVAVSDVSEMAFNDAKGVAWHRVRGLLEKGKPGRTGKFSQDLPAIGDAAIINGRVFESFPEGHHLPNTEQPAISNSAATAKSLNECGSKD
ncbi:hypothetical protein [Streptomyces sp. M1013]|uniref:hypothetical protein n=1 Tax=Streptomyces sp. M1013 TaxID=549798 RepID=UPI0011806499|nr:hypothetical protein [Streptomyces sp. M1013]